MKIGPKTKLLILGYLYFAVITAMSFYFKLHFVYSTILFMVVPTFVLFRLKKGVAKEVTLFVFSLGIPVGLYTQIIAERNFVWKYVPFLEFFQVLDIPLEAVLWYPVWFGLVIATYLYFFDKHFHKFSLKNSLQRHFKYFLFCIFVLILALVLLNVNAYYSIFPYAYLSLISPLILISFFLLIFQKQRHLFKVFLPTTLVLFLPMLMYDLSGVYSNQWTFPGQYLFVIDFGIAKLPFEEFFLWLWVWPCSVMAYFEEYETDFVGK